MRKRFEKTLVENLAIPIGLSVFGGTLAAAGIYVGEVDDAPGAALLGILLMIGLVTAGVRMAWRRCKASVGGQGS